MPKAAKVTHPPRRLLNCECDPPLKPLLRFTLYVPPPVPRGRPVVDRRPAVRRETHTHTAPYGGA
eukprot:6277930-Prymnesium_polylepis.2